MHKWITELLASGDPAASNESSSAIQMAWHEEF
jgi:Fe-S-cluster formation regulator IscX/YfhJ